MNGSHKLTAEPLAQRLRLPGTSQAAALEALTSELRERRGRDLDVDAGEVRDWGSEGIGLLLSAVDAWAGDGRRLWFLNPSPEFIDALERFGIRRADPSPQPLPPDRSMPLKVLTIDDSRIIRDLLASVLASAGYDVLQARDGMHGLEVLGGGALPDVIVTDLDMPRLDGIGFIKAVRADPRLSALPIMLLTAQADAATKARAREVGATGWMAKPFDLGKLLAAVRGLTPERTIACDPLAGIPHDRRAKPAYS